MKYDVVIIGSGLGGLECGCILARNGLHVLLLEQGMQPGGCMQSYRRHGFSFDTGFHYVGGLDEGQSLHAAFGYLGLLDLPWQRLDADGFDRVALDNRMFAFVQGYEGFYQHLADEFPAERKALHDYVGLLQQAGARQLDGLQPDVASSCWLPEFMDVSAWQYLQEKFHNPLLINVLSGTSLKMELRKESLPLFTFLHANSSFVESSWRLKGSGSLIADALAREIRALGGEIICNARVEELVEKNGRLVRAVCSGGEQYEGSFFISDIHPAQTCGLIKQSGRLKHLYRNRMAALENTFGMFTVSVCVKPGTLPYFNYNIYAYRSQDVWTLSSGNDAVNGLLVSCRVPEDGSEYARQVDLLTPMTWGQCKRWNYTTVGERGEDYEMLKRRMADECLSLAEKFLPGLRNSALGYTSTPLTWRDYTLVPEGSAYGVRKDYRNPLQTYLSPRTPVPNLFLTGQNLLLHGVHGVTLTAFYTCAEILGRDVVWKILKDG